MDQLLPKLKSLRLSGILATLDVRNQQAIAEKCTYVDFLEKLLEDEVERRNQKQLALRLRRSNLDPTKTLETFEFSFNPSINRQQVYDLATCAFVERSEAILLFGPAGVGKSSTSCGRPPCSRTSAAVAPTGRTTGGFSRTSGRTCSSWTTSASRRCARRRATTSTR